MSAGRADLIEFNSKFYFCSSIALRENPCQFHVRRTPSLAAVSALVELFLMIATREEF